MISPELYLYRLFNFDSLDSMKFFSIAIPLMYMFLLIILTTSPGLPINRFMYGTGLCGGIRTTKSPYSGSFLKIEGVPILLTFNP